MNKRLIAVLITAAVAAVLNAGVSTAAESPGVAGRAVPASPAFIHQAEGAGLSESQTATFNSKVDAYLEKTGGKQVAFNEIDLNGRGRVLVALPGEDYPRDFTSSAGKTAAIDQCVLGEWLNGYFCAYKSENYKGDRIEMYNCGSYSIPWISQGSWINNQKGGVAARFYNGSGSLIFTTPKPWSGDNSYSWAGVYTVRPC